MMKNADMKLITALRDNARETLTNISKKTRIPISTLYDKLKTNENSVILKHTTLLDFGKIGFSCRANIMLRTNREERDKLSGYLRAHPAINNLYKINNGYDFMVEGVFENVKEHEDFMDDVEKKFRIEEKKTHYIIEDLKREEFMTQGRAL